MKNLFFNYIFYYPIVMSIVWMLGALCFYWRRERNKPKTPPPLSRTPLVSVFIPAHNEETTIAESVHSIYQSRYQNLEVIVINDASTDRTQEILDGLQQQYPKLRVLQLHKNQGKAQGLNLALAISHGEVIMTLDADSMLDENAISWAVWHFITFPRVGAVTGNPRVRNRSTLLARLQTADYCSVIGLIKRAQRLFGKVMTVSGVVAAWRRTAIIHAGLWDTHAITDDIEMTWRLETKFWDIRYETNMLCWMLVPDAGAGNPEGAVEAAAAVGPGRRGSDPPSCGRMDGLAAAADLAHLRGLFPVGLLGIFFFRLPDLLDPPRPLRPV